MSAQAATVAPMPSQIKAGQILIQGRLRTRRRFGTQDGPRFENLVVMPAADAYSSPQTVSIISRQALGDADSDVRVLCTIGGRSRTYAMTDPDTGERRQVLTADNRLIAVE